MSMSLQLFKQLHAMKLHAHRCHSCQHGFVHSDYCAGDIQAHFCPKCGDGPWGERELPKELEISD